MLQYENCVIDVVRKLKIKDTPRTRRYSQFLDEGLLRATKNFDWKQLPFGDDADQNVRYAATLTGLMAFCWANPWSKHFHDVQLLTHVKARLLEFARSHVDGVIIFKDTSHHDVEMMRGKVVREGHSNSWQLEPLMLATLWLQEQFTADELALINNMIRRAADMHAACPLNEMNNRGVIRQAILALTGAYLNDPNLIDIARRDFHREPVRVFNEKDGQINEGTGPDGNYSGTCYIYCYIYRVFSGDQSIDTKMIDALRWFTWTSDPHGIVTLFGASTRMPFPEDSKVSDFLPAFERYADDIPHFSWLIDHGYLENKALGDPHHAVSSLIWAMLEHNGSTGVEDPKWFAHRNIKKYNPAAGPEFMYTNEGYSSLYFAFKQDYHATSTLVGRSPYKGFQHWSYRDEPPVIWPTESHASKTRAWGIDTSHFNVSGVKFRDRRWIEGPPHVLVTRFENVWQHHVLTPTTLLLLISTPLVPREDLWVINSTYCGTPIVGDGVITYADRRGRLFHAQPTPIIKKLPNATHLLFAGNTRTHLYAFSNESFRLDTFDANGNSVRFSDDTGSYELQYELNFHDDDAMRSIAYGTNKDTNKVRTVAVRL